MLKVSRAKREKKDLSHARKKVKGLSSEGEKYAFRIVGKALRKSVKSKKNKET